MYKLKVISILVVLFVLPISGFAQFNSEKNDSTGKVQMAAVPIVNYNNSLGFMGGGMLSGFYKLNVSDTISPSSSTMLAGIYTSNKSYMGLVVQNFYFNQDRWRGKMVAGTGDLFFQYLQGLPGALNGKYRDGGVWIDFDTKAQFIMGEIQRQVIQNFYVGIEAMFVHAETTFELPIGDYKPKSISDINSLGYTLQFDNRDDVNFPIKGFFVNFKNRFIRDWLGSTEDYDNYEFYINHFLDIKKNRKSVLVSRLYANIATGDVPFQGQNHIGGDDLRGYSKGEFRGNQIYTLQAELRQKVYKKFAMVGFVGLGSAVNNIGDIPDEDILPSIGLGVRYLMIAKEKINVGMDVGVGENDWSLTFRIGEAFSR